MASDEGVLNLKCDFMIDAAIDEDPHLAAAFAELDPDHQMKLKEYFFDRLKKFVKEEIEYAKRRP